MGAAGVYPRQPVLPGTVALPSVHVGEGPRDIEYGDGVLGRGAEVRGGKLVLLDGGNDLLDTTAAFLVHVHTTHEARESLITEVRRLINETKGINKGQARVGYLHPRLKELNHRPRTGDVEVLMEEGIGDKRPDRREPYPGIVQVPKVLMVTC